MDFEIRGKVSIGIFYFEDSAVIIDSGIDENEIRKTLNHLNDNKFKILGLLLTHYHADHSGGAFFAKKRGIEIFGTPETKFMLENPNYNHLVFTGFYSDIFINNKFITPSQVSIKDIKDFNYLSEIHPLKLPGHTIDHIGYTYKDLLFVGDALFSSENLEKHPIPYFVDYSNFRKSLDILLTYSGNKIICSHGGLLENPRRVINENIEKLDEILDLIDDELDNKIPLENLISKILNHYEIPRDPISYYLDSSPLRSIIFQNYSVYYEGGNLIISGKKENI